MTHRGPRNRERSFGVSVGGVLCVLAVALAWRGHVPRAEWTGAIGLVLLVVGLVHAPALKPLSDVWWKAAAALGWFNARVLLTLAFAIVVTPIGLVWRLTGRDPLARRRDQWPGWTGSPERYRNRRHFERMF